MQYTVTIGTPGRFACEMPVVSRREIKEREIKTIFVLILHRIVVAYVRGAVSRCDKKGFCRSLAPSRGIRPERPDFFQLSKRHLLCVQ
jgi:hypothetical protein